MICFSGDDLLTGPTHAARISRGKAHGRCGLSRREGTASEFEAVQGSSVDHRENQYRIALDLIEDDMTAMGMAPRRRAKLSGQPAHPRLRGEQFEAAFQPAFVSLRLPLSEILNAVDKYVQEIDISSLGSRYLLTIDTARLGYFHGLGKNLVRGSRTYAAGPGLRHDSAQLLQPPLLFAPDEIAQIVAGVHEIAAFDLGVDIFFHLAGKCDAYGRHFDILRNAYS
jgi:hypothetical protein